MPILLSFEAFDVEMSGELQILINDVLVATIPDVDRPEWNEIWVPVPFTFDITTICAPADNMIKFHNPLGTAYSRVRNVTVTKDGAEIFFSSVEAMIVGDPTTPTDALYGPFNIEYVPPPPFTAWAGIGEFYLLSDYNCRGVGTSGWIQKWTNLLDNIILKWSFNVIRLGFEFANLDPHPRGWNQPCTLPYQGDTYPYEALDQVLALFQQKGVKAVLDDHSYSNFGSQRWIDEWKALVTHIVNSPYRDVVVAYELRNEASEWSYEQEPWWNGQYCPNRTTPNWWEHVTGAYAACTDAVRAIDPTTPVIWSDPNAYYFGPTGPYIAAGHIRTNVYYAFHHWNPYNDLAQAENYAQVEINRMTYWINNYGPVWLGEFGSWTGHNQCSGTCTAPAQQATIKTLINWCVANNVGFSLYFYQHWNRGAEYDSILGESDYTPPVPPPPLCTTDADCPSETPFCVNGVCVECRTNADCPEGHLCINGTCTPPTPPVESVAIVAVGAPIATALILWLLTL